MEGSEGNLWELVPSLHRVCVWRIELGWLGLAASTPSLSHLDGPKQGDFCHPGRHSLPCQSPLSCPGDYHGTSRPHLSPTLAFPMRSPGLNSIQRQRPVLTHPDFFPEHLASEAGEPCYRHFPLITEGLQSHECLDPAPRRAGSSGLQLHSQIPS